MGDESERTAVEVVRSALPPSMSTPNTWDVGILDALAEAGFTVARLTRVGEALGTELWRKDEPS